MEHVKDMTVSGSSIHPTFSLHIQDLSRYSILGHRPHWAILDICLALRLRQAGRLLFISILACL